MTDDTGMDGTDRVLHDEAIKFRGETFELDDLVAKVEHVGTADHDPHDGDTRYTFDVHIRKQSTVIDQNNGD